MSSVIRQATMCSAVLWFVSVFVCMVECPYGEAESFYVVNDFGDGVLYEVTLGSPSVVTSRGVITTEPAQCLGYLAQSGILFTVRENRLNYCPIGITNISTITFPAAKTFDNYCRVSRDEKWIYLTGYTPTIGKLGFVVNAQTNALLPTTFGLTAVEDAEFISEPDVLYYSEKIDGHSCIVKAELPSGTTSVVYSFPEQDIIARTVVELESELYFYAGVLVDETRETALYRLDEGERTHLTQVDGRPLQGNPGDRNWYFYDKPNEQVTVWSMDTSAQSTFSAKFTDHLEPGQVLPVTGDDALRWNYTFDGAFRLAPPTFTDAYVSPSGRYLVFAFADGLHYPGYVTIYDTETSTWQDPIRIGAEVSGGLSNIVFVPDE